MVQKRIIIVGASSGIGREIASIYAEKGFLVGITGRRKDLLIELQKKYPDMIFISSFDVRGNNNMEYIKKLIDEMGGLDLLIYNAGFGEPSEKLNLELDRITTETNVLGFVEIVNPVFNYFIKQGQGQIAITSSIAGLRGNSVAPAYSASKAFISSYSESLNIIAKKIRSKIVCTDLRPGFVGTKMAKGNGQFWVSSPQKAAKQIVNAIEKKKRVAYITKRWWIIGNIMKLMPFHVYRRLV